MASSLSAFAARFPPALTGLPICCGDYGWMANTEVTMAKVSNAGKFSSLALQQFMVMVNGVIGFTQEDHRSMI